MLYFSGVQFGVVFSFFVYFCMFSILVSLLGWVEVIHRYLSNRFPFSLKKFVLHCRFSQSWFTRLIHHWSACSSFFLSMYVFVRSDMFVVSRFTSIHIRFRVALNG